MSDDICDRLVRFAGKVCISTDTEVEAAAEITRLREENARLREAIERALVGGNHVALLIGADHPPDTATHDAARKHYGSRHDEYEAWCCWKAIRAAAAAIREGGKD